MRVLQLIDSLRSGGAERMSVIYANALSKNIEKSLHCCTRSEGLLKPTLGSEVIYKFLNKKNTFDIKAFLKLRNFVKENGVHLIQAHSSSWFLALLVKITLPKLKLVWHDHYGKDLSRRKKGILKPCSIFFDGIISVNADLKIWAEEELYCRNNRFIRNFIPGIPDSGKEVKLRGANRFNIICVANFRPQKDHLNLLQAFNLLKSKYSDIGLHLIGKDDVDDYSKEIKEYIATNKLEKDVFIYGEQDNINPYLRQADLGVLSSKSEGLPLALLEYGQAGLPVVCTEVGECSEVIGRDGGIVIPGNPEALAEVISFYINNEEKRTMDAKSFQKKIISQYNPETVTSEVINFFRQIVFENKTGTKPGEK